MQDGYARLPGEERRNGMGDAMVEDTDAVPSARDYYEEADGMPVVEAVLSELRRPRSELDLKAGNHFENVWAHARAPCNNAWVTDFHKTVTEYPIFTLAGHELTSPFFRFGSTAEGLVQHARQLLALLDLVFVPFVLAFRPIHAVEEHWQVKVVDFWLTLTFLILALPVRLVTSFVSIETRGEVTDPGEIIRKVLRTAGFWLDALSVVIAPTLYAPSWRGFSLLRLAKCWQLGRPMLRDVLLGIEPFVGVLAKVILAIYVIAHLFACVWFASKMMSPEGQGREWTEWGGWPKAQISEEDRKAEGVSLPVDECLDLLWINYMRSLKDGVYMLTTWGGPDALSDLQLGLVCILGPASTVLSGLILAQIVEITSQRRVLQTQYANRMAMVTAACDGLGLPVDLRQRIARYHSYLAFHQADEGSKDMLFGGLSVNLFAEVKLHCLRDVLVTTTFFEGLPPRLLSFLIVSFEETTFSPGDFVVRKGEIGDQMSIILKGIVGLCVTDLQNVVKVMGSGSCFGEISLVFPFPRTAWIYAASYSMLMQLSKGKFDFVLQECPSEKHVIVGRIVRSCGRLVPDLERVVQGEDYERAALAKEVLDQIRHEFDEDEEGGDVQAKAGEAQGKAEKAEQGGKGDKFDPKMNMSFASQASRGGATESSFIDDMIEVDSPSRKLRGTQRMSTRALGSLVMNHSRASFASPTYASGFGGSSSEEHESDAGLRLHLVRLEERLINIERLLARARQAGALADEPPAGQNNPARGSMLAANSPRDTAMPRHLGESAMGRVMSESRVGTTGRPDRNSVPSAQSPMRASAVALRSQQSAASTMKGAHSSVSGGPAPPERGRSPLATLKDLSHSGLRRMRFTRT